jgi:hypothetical protein
LFNNAGDNKLVWPGLESRKMSEHIGWKNRVEAPQNVRSDFVEEKPLWTMERTDVSFQNQSGPRSQLQLKSQHRTKAS